MDKTVISTYYDSGVEVTRLSNEALKLEGIRSKEIISRYLAEKEMHILDIGGATGFYSFWLQSLGHDVSLIDLSPFNVQFAREYSAAHDAPLAVCEVGDATRLPFDDNMFDMVLLMGPLYHLTSREERISALREAGRVLKPDGILIAAIISRYASLLDGFKRNLIADDQFVKILLHDLKTGIHLNHTSNPEYFTTSFFHSPDEIKEEVAESKLKFEKLISVESVGWMLENRFDAQIDESEVNKILDIIRIVETNNDLMAVSPHILVVARKI